MSDTIMTPSIDADVSPVYHMASAADHKKLRVLPALVHRSRSFSLTEHS